MVTATATGNTVSGSNQTSTATATCPSGKQAVGGGFSVPLTAATAFFVNTSFRSTPNAWTVSALRQTGSGAATAFAYCRNTSRSISEVTGTVPSGGVWMVQAVNNSTGARAITVHAYCMAKIAAPRYVDASSSPSIAQFATGSLSSPACPKAKKPKKKGKKKKPAQLLLAGGFAAQSTVPIEIFGESRIDGKTWLNSGINVTGPTGAIHLTSQGICV